MRRLKKRFVRWLLKDLDELKIGNSMVMYPDRLRFHGNTADPTVSEGDAWYRSDQGFLYMNVKGGKCRVLPLIMGRYDTYPRFVPNFGDERPYSMQRWAVLVPASVSSMSVWVFTTGAMDVPYLGLYTWGAEDLTYPYRWDDGTLISEYGSTYATFFWPTLFHPLPPSTNHVAAFRNFLRDGGTKLWYGVPFVTAAAASGSSMTFNSLTLIISSKDYDTFPKVEAVFDKDSNEITFNAYDSTGTIVVSSSTSVTLGFLTKCALYVDLSTGDWEVWYKGSAQLTGTGADVMSTAYCAATKTVVTVSGASRYHVILCLPLLGWES